MDHFTYQNGVLRAEGIAIPSLAEEVGTPFYVYAAATVRRHYDVFAAGFEGTDALVAFSVKALSNIAVLRLLANKGAGADIVSGGELHRALTAGIPAGKIVFSGVGKTADEMAAALDAGIHQFNVESEAELVLLSQVAADKGTEAPVALRVNPDVEAGTLDGISTGRKEDKFGIAWDEADRLYAFARDLPGTAPVGVDVHIGSQIASLAPFEAATRKAVSLVTRLRRQGHAIDRLDLGGGLGVPYGDGVTPPSPGDYLKAIRRLTDPLGAQLIFEPGRMIVGNAGLLVARLLYVKRQPGRQFLILDAGMNDLMRPALYKARHAIVPVVIKEGDEEIYDVVGPVCESTDLFARDVAFTDPQAGDLVAFRTAGAYGAVQASQYNSRPLVPEVLVQEERAAMVRRRPSLEEMLSIEAVPDWLA